MIYPKQNLIVLLCLLFCSCQTNSNLNCGSLNFINLYKPDICQPTGDCTVKYTYLDNNIDTVYREIAITSSDSGIYIDEKLINPTHYVRDRELEISENLVKVLSASTIESDNDTITYIFSKKNLLFCKNNQLIRDANLKFGNLGVYKAKYEILGFERTNETILGTNRAVLIINGKKMLNMLDEVNTVLYTQKFGDGIGLYYYNEIDYGTNKNNYTRNLIKLELKN